MYKITKLITAIWIISISCFLSNICLGNNNQNGWQTIFNGKDLTGWDGDPRFWSVKDGAIRGETTEENPAEYNTFCIWRGGKLKDFELKLKYRLIGNNNSGVQYRSKELDKWRIAGYQAEVANAQNAGFLYDERGRASLVNVGQMVVIDSEGNKSIVGRVSDRNELINKGFYNNEDWNEYHIIAQGNHILHYLNGYPTIALVDNDRLKDPDNPRDTSGASREGLLALQIHSGQPMTIEFKDISIRNIKSRYGDAVVIFNGQNLNDWSLNGDQNKSKWTVGTAKMSPDDSTQLINDGDSGDMINLTPESGESIDIYSKENFGDCRIELELMVPQGSNSGIYVMGEYEIQVLDSWGKTDLSNGDMGAVYGAAPPKVNACKKPGQWQKYIIEFQAPKFDATGKKISNAKFIKIELNGQILHENLEMSGPTPGGLSGKENPTGPLMFQGNHGPVAFRNILIKPIIE